MSQLSPCGIGDRNGTGESIRPEHSGPDIGESIRPGHSGPEIGESIMNGHSGPEIEKSNLLNVSIITTSGCVKLSWLA